MLNTGRYTQNIITSLYTPLPTTEEEDFAVVWFVCILRDAYEPAVFQDKFPSHVAGNISLPFIAGPSLFYNSRISAGSVSLIVRISLILPRKIEAFSLSLCLSNSEIEPWFLKFSSLELVSRIFHFIFLFILYVFLPSILHFLSS